MNEKVEEGLAICIKTALILKDVYPNDIMKIQKNTIVPFTSSKRLCDNVSLGGYAHYHRTKPHRICIQQKVLNKRECLITKIKNQGDRHMLHGNFALIELMCHELAHHRTKGHAKGFKVKYHRFLDTMVNKVMSGEFYEP